ncbi:MAG: hypothetical protein ACTSP9_04495 [Promethearchaeota archaeon]
MEHKSLSIEEDENLLIKILDSVDMRYIILYMYIIRNDLLKDLSDFELIKSYERVLILDEIFKNNIIEFWDEEFIEIMIDLGIFKNVRSLREFNRLEGDFILKLGEETITIENDTISIPDHVLFLIIKKKFKFLTRRNFNLALTRLKSVSCEKSSIIHPFIYEIGDHDYTLSNDLFYILDQFGNVYQTVKIEITIEGFYQRFEELLEKINIFIEIFDPVLNSKPGMKKIDEALEQEKEVISFLKDSKIQLSDKFNLDNIEKSDDTYKKWYKELTILLSSRYELNKIQDQLNELRSLYSGKKKKNNYLKFIEKISFNEDDIVDTIQDTLIKLRKEIVEINNQISDFTKKELKLLNLDYERIIIESKDE